MAKLKTTRTFTKAVESVVMTDALYSKLSKGNKILAAQAEALEIEVQIATYEGRNYIADVTLDELADTIFA